MIPGDAPQAIGTAALGGRATLDDLFRHAALRRPDAIALCDPPNRESFTAGAPRRLTYAEADRAICAIAAKLRRLGLRTDAVVGIQLPNTVESVLTLLGVLRAGMIAAPLPLLWRRAEIASALGRMEAKALITCCHVGAVDHADLARHAAIDVFSIRYVCAFGDALPDGVVAFNDAFGKDKLDTPPQVERDGIAAAHLAVITSDTTAGGFVPVARNHMEIVAGGVGVMLEGRLHEDAVFLSALAPSSFAGLCLTVLPWLLTGGTLFLHQPFDPETFALQSSEHRCGVVILPGPVVPRLAQAGYFAVAGDLKTVMSLWHSPERVGQSAVWSDQQRALVDVVAFGEAGLIAARRGVDGRPAPLVFGAVTAPRGAAGAVAIAELTRTEAGTLAIRGPMVPRRAFPPGAEAGDLPYFNPVHGAADTGYTCRVDRHAGTIEVTGPPSGIVSVGGYRFALRDLQRLAADAEGRARIAALPDALCGQRLSGFSENPDTVRAALARRSVNPLIVGAFG